MEQPTTLLKSTSTRRSTAVETNQQPAVNWSRRHPFVQVRDVDGWLWDVHEARATKHGFDLLFGRSANSHLDGTVPPRKPQLIATPELIAYWDTHRIDVHTIRDLPANASTLGRVRREHGFNFFADRRAVWQERLPELKVCSNREFAESHGLKRDVASRWRMRLIGRTARPLDWWHDPAILDLLRSTLDIREVAAKLGIDRSWAARLRKYAHAASNDDLAKRNARKQPDKFLRWQTAEVVAILRSPITARQAAEKLGISPSHVLRLRHALASNNQLIAA